MELPVYLDNNATTRLDPDVLDAMLPYLTEQYGNAASKSHSLGWKAEFAVEDSREIIADFLGCTPTEIVFTSGATESNNLAIKGVARAYKAKGKHIISSPIEHKAVLDSIKYLVDNEGFESSLVELNSDGLVDPEKLRKLIRPDTTLISIMAANNEIGTINPIQEIAAIAKEKEIIFHTDAVQAVGKVALNVKKDGIDLLSLSGHKIYGPKGIGALYVRRRDPKVQLEACTHGGGHENGFRSGTLNVPGIVGLAKACELMKKYSESESQRILKLRERLLEGIQGAFPDISVNGDLEQRLYSNLNIAIPFVSGESLGAGLGKSIAVSSGSACNSSSANVSYVLSAIGLSNDLAGASIRFGLGRFTTEEEIDFAIDVVYNTVNKLRASSPLYKMTPKGRNTKECLKP